MIRIVIIRIFSSFIITILITTIILTIDYLYILYRDPMRSSNPLFQLFNILILI